MDGERSTRGERTDREGSSGGVSVKDAFASALDVLDEGGDLEPALAGLDDAVREAVEGLLAAHGRAAGKLLDATDDTQTGWSGLGRSAQAKPIAIEPPVIEGYSIGEEIGRGGFGVVYRAVQRVPVERVVAVKLLRHELASRGVVRRFRAEGRLLARMNHPGISRVLDAGVDGRGRPFVVTEFVDGAPITEVCDAKRLGVRERVGLMAAVCEAVHHAHQRAVIHRDLKPANMLVEEVDGALRARVIDFGIAKLLDAEDGDAVTIAGDRLGTPRYMSPEQREGGDAADVRSDVYALGVVLCEVLTGRVPGSEDSGGSLKSGFRSGTRSGSFGGMKPSALVGSDETGSARARMLKGDLDRIVMKATARYPDSRYPSAMAMAQDLHRYLEGLPVTATAPGPVYLARKFVGRHRAITGMAAMLVIAVVGSVAALGYGAREARVGRLQAERSLEVAEEERARAEKMSSFLLGSMLIALDPDQYQGDRSLPDLLRDVSAEALGALADEPEVRLGVLERVGQAQRAIGDTVGAAETLTQAAVLSRSMRGEADAATIDLRLDVLLARLSSRQQLDYPAEIEYLIGLATEHLDAEHPTRYRAELHRMHVLAWEDRISYARGIERRVAASEHSGSPLHFEVMRYLAGALVTAEPGEALDLSERALEDSVRRYGPRHSQTIEVRFGYAEALKRTGRSEDSQREYLLLLEHASSVGGRQSVYYQTALSNLVVVLRERGDIDRALGYARQQVELAREQYGEVSSQFAGASRQVALCHRAAGSWDESQEAFEAAVHAYRRFDRGQRMDALLVRAEYGEMLVEAGNWERAVAEADRVIDALDAGHELRVRAAVLKANALVELEEMEAAQRFVDVELEYAERVTGERPLPLEQWREQGDPSNP